MQQKALKRTSGPDRVIIGIDPGTNVMGYGILNVAKGKPSVAAMGVLKLAVLKLTICV